MARAVDEVRSLEQHGVDEAVVRALVEAGVHGLGHLLEMSDEELSAIDGAGPERVEAIREAAAQAKADWEAHDAAEEAERLAAEQAQAEQDAADAAAEAAAVPEEGAPDAAAVPDESAPDAGAAGATDGDGAGRSGQEGGTDGER